MPSIDLLERSSFLQSDQLLKQEENIPVVSPIKEVEKAVLQEEASPGLLQRIANYWYNWWNGGESVQSKENKASESAQAIDFKPQLEKPELDTSIQQVTLPKVLEMPGTLSDQHVFEGLKALHDKTLLRVMLIVLAAQAELDKEGALVNLDTMETLHRLEKSHKKQLQAIKEALLKDEKFRGYFKTAQDFAIAVATIASLATMVAGFSPLAFYASSGVAALSAGVKSYFGVNSDEHQAQLLRVKHDSAMHKMQLDDTAERLEKIMASKADSEKAAAELLRRELALVESILSN